MRLLEGLLSKVKEEVLLEMVRGKNRFPSTIDTLSDERQISSQVKVEMRLQKPDSRNCRRIRMKGKRRSKVESVRQFS